LLLVARRLLHSEALVSRNERFERNSDTERVG
jgi:hypothetical protein